MLDIEEIVVKVPEGVVVQQDSPLVVFDPIEAGLQALRDEATKTVFDCTTKAGDDAARQFRAGCVKIRTSADRAYKEWNEPMLDMQRQMRGKRDYIKDEVTQVEEPIDSQIKAEESRKAAEKAERERIERERILVITTKIEAIKGIPIFLINENSEGVQTAIAQLEARPIELEEFGDFTGEAASAKSKALETLSDMHTKKVLAEQAAEAARQEQLKLEEQRRQQAEAERQQRAEQARIAAEQKAITDAAAKDAAEQLAQAQAILAEAKRVQAENERQAAEAKRVEAERLQKSLEVDAQAKAAAEAACAMPKESPAVEAEISLGVVMADSTAAVLQIQPEPEEERPSDESIIRAIGDAFDVDAATAIAWIIEVGRNAEQANQLRKAA
ncbi:MAG: hypothetical protein IPO08_23340 [Xanthomonadales bacterium]|nr:hypothetical protein [Xanthomonadales bacterium]